MNKKWKQAFSQAFEAPPPTQKEAFLGSLSFPKLTMGQCFLRQLQYIRKRVWLFTVILALLGFAALGKLPEFAVISSGLKSYGIITALLPLLVLLTACELNRSTIYGMAELEIACRFSLSQIVAARAAILGSLFFLLLALLLAISLLLSPLGVIRMAVYLLLPYLTTCAVSLLLLNRIRGTEGIYVCAAAAFFTSFLYGSIVLSPRLEALYAEALLPGGLAVCLALALLILTQLKKITKTLEVALWN